MSQYVYFKTDGLTTTYVDPNKPENRFTHKLEVRNRKLGQNKQRVVRSEFSITKMVPFKLCDNSCSIDGAEVVRITLSGASPEQLASELDSLVAVVKQAITNKVLVGIPIGHQATITFD